jgi:glucose-1-phosphate cytidylyltransferase
VKALLLAGSLGTRLSEETGKIPKPIAEADEKLLYWNIIKIYPDYGNNNFIICCVKKGLLIKEYFQNYFLCQSDMIFQIEDNITKVHQNNTVL